MGRGSAELLAPGFETSRHENKVRGLVRSCNQVDLLKLGCVSSAPTFSAPILVPVPSSGEEENSHVSHVRSVLCKSLSLRHPSSPEGFKPRRPFEVLQRWPQKAGWA